MQVLQPHGLHTEVSCSPAQLPRPLLLMDTNQLREFTREYRSMLADLTFNHKPIITSLSMLAGEHKGAASSIVAEIRQRILEVRHCTF